MAKFSRACLGALLLACVALPVISAGQRPVDASDTATNKTQEVRQQRVEQLGDALRRIQAQPMTKAEAPAASARKIETQPAANNGDAEKMVTVQVSAELEAQPAFKEMMKDVPHALMANGSSAKGSSELMFKQKDVARLQQDVDSRRGREKNARMDELAASLRAVQDAKFDIHGEKISVDAAETAPSPTDPAPAGAPVPTPAQIDAQQAAGSAPAPSPAQTPGLDVKAVAPGEAAPSGSGVYTAAPPANPTPPAPAAPATGTPVPAPSAPVVADAPAPVPTPTPVPDSKTPAAPAADGNTPAGVEPPAKRDESAAPIANESNSEIAHKMHEIAGKGKQALDEQGITAANGKAAKAGKKDTAVAVEPKPVQGNPLDQRVNLDFREMELTNVVALLASKAGINVIAGTDLTGTVTANLRNVPLRQAIETALRMNGLGMVEEEGIYRIVTYEEAISTQRVTQMLNLQNAKAEEVRKLIDEIIKGSPDERHVSISANDTANVLVISGPVNRVPELVAMANKLDIAKPVLPTTTEAIKLNYAEPKDVIPTVTAMLSKDVGKVAIDERSRHLIVTDVPVSVENVREMLKTLDKPVKTVGIETMVVDVNLTDGAETGVDWVVNLVRSQSLREAAKGSDGRFISDLQKANFQTALPSGAQAGALTFGLLTGNIDWTGVIKAEIQNFNGKLMSAPSVLTVENKPATITIAEEIPYIELVQTAAGGQQNRTSFKEVGTVMEVTPRVSHDNFIISNMRVKESNTSGSFNNVPIENKRELSTSLRTADGQTVFMGGLRKSGDEYTVRKVPVLGDIPVVNFMFRNNKKTDRKVEMVVFMTCHVVKDGDEITPYQQDMLDKGSDPKLEVNAGNELLEDTIHPGDLRDPAWKYRRTAN